MQIMKAKRESEDHYEVLDFMHVDEKFFVAYADVAPNGMDVYSYDPCSDFEDGLHLFAILLNKYDLEIL